MIVLISRVIRDKEALMSEYPAAKIFNTLDEYQEFASAAPVDITTLLTTSDVFMDNIKGRCNQYFDITEDKFLKCNEFVHLVNDKRSKEVEFLTFRNPDIKVKEIVISQEILVATIEGRIDLDSRKIKPFTMHRMSKAQYLELSQEQQNNVLVSQNDMLDDIEVQDIPQELEVKKLAFNKVPTNVIQLLQTSVSINQCAAFATIYAEYLSRMKKVAVIENDPHYKLLTHLLSKSCSKDVTVVDIFEFFKNPYTILETIGEKNSGIILFTSEKKECPLDSAYYTTIITNLLKGYVDYVINIANPKDSLSGHQVCVLSTDFVDTLKAIREIPMNIENIKFLGIDSMRIEETQVLNDKVYSSLLTDLLSTPVDSKIVRIDSLAGGDLSDIHLYIE